MAAQLDEMAKVVEVYPVQWGTDLDCCNLPIGEQRFADNPKPYMLQVRAPHDCSLAAISAS